jgi:hypothetical protein
VKVRPLPHEVAFGALYAITITRLLLAGAGMGIIGAWLGLVALSAAGMALTGFVAKPWAWRV